MAKLNQQQRAHIVQRFLNEADKLAPKTKAVPIPAKLKGKFKVSVDVTLCPDRWDGVQLQVDAVRTPSLDTVLSQQPGQLRALYAKYKDDVKAVETRRKSFQTKRHDARLALEEKLLFMGSDLDIEAVLADALKKFK